MVHDLDLLLHAKRRDRLMTVLHGLAAVHAEVDGDVWKRPFVRLDPVLVLTANVQNFLTRMRVDVPQVHLEGPGELEKEFLRLQLVADELALHELALVVVHRPDGFQRAGEERVDARGGVLGPGR